MSSSLSSRRLVSHQARAPTPATAATVAHGFSRATYAARFETCRVVSATREAVVLATSAT